MGTEFFHSLTLGAIEPKEIMKIIKILKTLLTKQKLKGSMANRSQLRESSTNHSQSESISHRLNQSLIKGDYQSVKNIINDTTDLNMNTAEFFDRPVLYYLVGNYHTPMEIIKYVLEKGADPNFKDAKGKNAFFHCVKMESLAVLMHYGCNINHIDNSGNNLLFNFVSHSEMFNWCIENGVDVNHKDTNGFNILYLLVHSGRPETVSKLILHGISFDYHPSTNGSLPNWFVGYTPLHYYIYYLRPSLVKSLLENGADIQIKTIRDGYIYKNMNDEVEPIPAGITGIELFNICKPFYKACKHEEDHAQTDMQIEELENCLSSIA